MNSYVGEKNRVAAENNNFREVLFTSGLSQLVVMCLKGGEEIGSEVPNDIDQFIWVESGEGKSVLDGKAHEL